MYSLVTLAVIINVIFSWVSFFFDLHITAAVFPAGLWYCVKNVNDERVFSQFIFLCLSYLKDDFHSFSTLSLPSTLLE